MGKKSKKEKGQQPGPSSQKNLPEPPPKTQEHVSKPQKESASKVAPKKSLTQDTKEISKTTQQPPEAISQEPALKPQPWGKKVQQTAQPLQSKGEVTAESKEISQTTQQPPEPTSQEPTAKPQPWGPKKVQQTAQLPLQPKEQTEPPQPAPKMAQGKPPQTGKREISQPSQQPSQPRSQKPVTKPQPWGPKNVQQEAQPPLQSKEQHEPQPPKEVEGEPNQPEKLKPQQQAFESQEPVPEKGTVSTGPGSKSVPQALPQKGSGQKATQPKPGDSEVGPQSQGSAGDQGGSGSNLPLSSTSCEKFEYIPAKQSYKANTGMRPPPRPGYGREGRPIKLQANHFKLNISLNNIHHYDIDITPNKLPKKLNRLIFEDLVLQNQDGCFKNVKAVYDGNKNFYTVQQLPLKEVVLNHEVLIEERKLGYKAKIQYAALINLFQLQEFWEGRCNEMPQDAVQAIDVAIKHNANLREIPAGRSLYSFPENFMDLGEGCELWMGRFQSVRPTQWKMTLNIDMAATAFYQPLPVIEFMNSFLRARQPLTTLNNFDRIKLQKELKNIKVRVDHQGSIKRTYVVREITKIPATQVKFTMERDGVQQTMTVADYFSKQYNKRLRFPNLPCLRVGNPQKQIYLPLEVCCIKEGQKKNNKVSDQMVANMIRFTAIPAPERKQKILNAVQKAGFNSDPLMRAFGISVDDRLMEMDGRIIEPPAICYVDQAKISTVQPNRGVWDMRRGQKFFRGAQVKTWALICFENQNRCPNDALRRFFGQMSDIGKDMGMELNPNPAYTTYARDASHAQNIFSEIVKTIPDTQLIVVILPGRSQIYGEIKRLGDVMFGILTQCIQSKNVTRSSPSLLVNICLKINVKCEGLNSYIQCPAKVSLFREPVIVFGADVTHPMPGDTSMPSIAAVVASMDSYPQKYTACVKAQGHRVEIIENLCDMVTILLKQFYRSTKAKPRKIIFYRDGVSEGQFLQVLQFEVAAIQRACTLLERDYQPLITFAVVQKRHHTRLFCANPRDQVGKSGNIPPGTIVDKGIVHPREFDFFLCSHAGIQGTSRPTHYHILWDDNNFTADEFQSFTYALCHTYVRCNRAVSIPAPAYYAHHVAFRARYHLGDLHSDTASSMMSSEVAPMNLESMNKAITIQPGAAQRMYFA